MMKNLRRAAYSLVLFSLFALFTESVVSQDNFSPVQVKLSLAGEKKVFKIGETIRLELTFSTTSTYKDYHVSMGVEPTDTYQDEVTISPTQGVFDWKKAYMGGATYTSDAISLHRLSEGPVKVPLSLNYFVRFDAGGKYSVRLKTLRAGKYGFRSSEGEKNLELVTNEVAFEVIPMTETEEAAEVKRIAAAFDKATDVTEKLRLAEALENLAGDAAIPEKVSRYLAARTSGPGNLLSVTSRGLTISRNLPLVIKLLETAFRNRTRAVDYSLLNTLSGVRAFHERLESSVPLTPRSWQFGVDQQYEKVREKYLDELVESLPHRKGQNLTTTAMTILTTLPREGAPPDIVAKIRAILLKEFDTLDIFSRERLIEVYWNKLGTPSLIPSLERMLRETNYPDYGRTNVRSSALKRLIELDSERARPFVIAEIQDADSMVGIDVLELLPDKTLPEVDEALVKQISKFADVGADRFNDIRLQFKCLVAARFATNVAYTRLFDIYKTYSDSWQADSKGAILGYFARHNDSEAIASIENELAKMEEGRAFSFLTHLTKASYSTGINELLKHRLFDNNPENASTAAYLMSKYGPAENRSDLEKRLDLWIKEWRGKSEQLNKSNGGGAVRNAMLQVNLIDALSSAKSWKLSIDEQRQLSENCLSENCKEYFKQRLPR